MKKSKPWYDLFLLVGCFIFNQTVNYRTRKSYLVGIEETHLDDVISINERVEK